eukprot:6754619-Prymnesium_polylepis.1
MEDIERGYRGFATRQSKRAALRHNLPLRGPPRSRSRTCTHGRRRRGVICRICAIESAHA